MGMHFIAVSMMTIILYVGILAEVKRAFVTHNLIDQHAQNLMTVQTKRL